MTKKVLSAWMVAALVLAGVTACDGDDGEDPTDTTTTDTVDDTTMDSFVEDTTDDPVEDPIPDTIEEVAEDTYRDCNGMYPGGPFGFKGSIYRATSVEIGTWDGGGDLMENICMRNQDDVYTCIAPYYCSNEVDVLMYDFTAMWCPPCNQAASEEAAFVAWMEDHGWNVEFLSMLEEDETGDRPTLEDANAWKDLHGITGPIMWDYNWLFHTRPFYDTRPEESLRGWPTFLIVNPDNMKIWDAFSGWSGGVTFYEYLLAVFEIGAANDPGYIP